MLDIMQKVSYFHFLINLFSNVCLIFYENNKNYLLIYLQKQKEPIHSVQVFGRKVTRHDNVCRELLLTNVFFIYRKVRPQLLIANEVVEIFG